METIKVNIERTQTIAAKDEIGIANSSMATDNNTAIIFLFVILHHQF